MSNCVEASVTMMVLISDDDREILITIETLKGKERATITMLIKGIETVWRRQC